MTGADAAADRAGAVLPEATARLGAAGVEAPARDARLLLAHALAIPAARLTLALSDPLPAAAAARFAALIDRRCGREPLSHLLGRRSFWGRDFTVTADVLDPRPETETLIAAALCDPFDTVLDLGTGSGCIALTLLAERSHARATATDISAAALAVARANADRLGVAARATFLQGDWTAPLPPDARFDLVVSNPPYIAAEDYARLAPEPRLHEPRDALTDGGDGLGAYRALAAHVRAVLAPGGRLLVEIGPTQADATAALFAAAGLQVAPVLRDLDGRPRCIAARAETASPRHNRPNERKNTAFHRR